MLNHPGLAVLQSDICLIFQNTCGKVANMKRAKEVFQITGLHSFNTCVFWCGFFPSKVSNRAARNWNENPTGEISKEFQMPMLIEKNIAGGNTYANSPKNKSPHEGSEREVERVIISPSSIFPLVKAKYP